MDGQTLKTVSKAIAGVIVGLIAYFLAKYNFMLDTNLNDALQVIIIVLIGSSVFYVAPKSAEPANTEPKQ